jgi:3-hexulose-6-phosphate synthase
MIYNVCQLIKFLSVVVEVIAGVLSRIIMQTRCLRFQDKGTHMRLQLALDVVDIAGAKSMLAELNDIIDIVEIGTPFILKEGVKAITEIKKAYPFLRILADVKIMDAGDHEARLAYDAGADIVTVLGAAADITIQNVVRATRECQKEVMVDMIAVQDIETRVKHIDKFAVDYICVHTASDVQQQGQNPYEELKLLHRVLQYAKPAVAGGITADKLPHLIPYHPEIVIVGSAITGKPDKRKAALEFKKLMKG